MLRQDTAAAVLEEALTTGGDFAEIFLEDRRNNLMTMRSGRIDTATSNRLHGAGVRIYSGVSSVYVYTDGMVPAAQRFDQLRPAGSSRHS